MVGDHREVERAAQLRSPCRGPENIDGRQAERLALCELIRLARLAERTGDEGVGRVRSVDVGLAEIGIAEGVEGRAVGPGLGALPGARIGDGGRAADGDAGQRGQNSDGAMPP